MVFGYARVSGIKQDTDNQKYEIERWAERNGVVVDKYLGETITSRRADREIFGIIDGLREGDILVVSELSRIARSLRELIDLIDIFLRKKIRMVLIKESFDLTDDNPAAILVINMLGSVAQFERSMISTRTKEALASKREAGIRLGRPEGSKNKKRVWSGKETEIEKYLKMGLNKSAIAKLTGISRDSLYEYLEERAANGS